MMSALISFLAMGPRRSPLTVLEQASHRLSVYSVDRSGAKVVATGVPRIPPGTPESLAATFKGIYVSFEKEGRRSVWLFPVEGNRVREGHPTAAPAQVAALMISKDGRCFGGTLLGNVYDLEATRSHVEQHGNVARTTARLSPMDDGGYVLSLNFAGMGDSSSQSLFLGRTQGADAFREGTWLPGPDTVTDAVYLHATRELFAFRGNGLVERITEVGASGARTPTSRILSLEGRTGVLGSRFRDGTWVVADADGTLWMGALKIEGWQWYAKARLPIEIDAWTQLRISDELRSVIVCQPRTGSVWSVPVVSRTMFGTPRSLVRKGRNCLLQVSPAVGP